MAFRSPRTRSILDMADQVDRETFAGGSAGPASVLVCGPERTVCLRSYSHFRQPGFRPLERRQIFSDLCYEAAALRLFRLNNARFLGTSLFFTSDEGDVIKESVTHWRAAPLPEDETILPTLAKKARRGAKPIIYNYWDMLGVEPFKVEGPCILLASYYAENYHHWHTDLLPALELWKSVGSLQDVKVLVERDSEYVHKSLAYYGLRPDQLVWLPEDRPTKVEQLIFCSVIETVNHRIHPGVGDVFRTVKAAVVRESGDTPRRLFVSRGEAKRRLLLNRVAVEERFAAAGFHVVDPGTLSYEDQIRLFHEAAVVVGEHGGGLGNIGFCQPGALVVELFHPLHNALCYLSLAEVQDLRHQIFLGDYDPTAEIPEVRQWTVDVDAVWDFTAGCMDLHARALGARLA